jgi:chaperonin GroEL
MVKVRSKLLKIKSQIEVAKSNFEIEKLQERLSKLTGGVAIINIGGKSEVELKEKKDRADDALHATKAALDQGIVPGGGMALINCVDAVNAAEYDNDDQRMGSKIVEKALYSPFKTILLNAGVEDYHAILSKITTGKAASSNPGWEGYNVKSGTYVNMMDEGILDPTKVTKTAIENAASVAGTILTTQSVVYSVAEEKKDDIDYSQFMG